MYCKACPNRLREEDYYTLPDGELNTLCKECVEASKNLVDVDWEGLTHQIRMILYDGRVPTSTS